MANRKIPSPLIAVVSVLLLASALALFIWRRPSMTPVIATPQRVPSSGLAWSRANFPRRYRAGNRTTVTMKGIDVRGYERFHDVANNAFSRSVVSTFSYTDPERERPDVTVTYLRKAETFIGHISAKGLKPNFAYQLKLQGNYQADPAGHERIGYLGRWRFPGRGTNYTDQQYRNAWDPADVESYILFDFFVTDHNGNTEKDFYLDSTLHVLFNETYQRKNRKQDSLPLRVRLAATQSDIYVNPKAEVPVQAIYAETEAGSNRQQRPQIGEAFLPKGRYQADLVLVEETFHGYGYGDTGYWPTVMSAPVSFRIVKCNERPGLGWGKLPKTRKGVSLDRAKAMDAKVRTRRGELLTVRPNGPRPRIAIEPPLTMSPGPRYVLVFEVKSGGGPGHSLEITPVGDPDLKQSFPLKTAGRRRWRRFEIEITPRCPGNRFILTYVLPRDGPGMQLRNVRLAEIGPPGNLFPALSP